MQLKIKFTKEGMIHFSGLIAQYISLIVLKTHVATIIQHEKRTDMQNSEHLFGVQYHLKILEIRISNLS